MRRAGLSLAALLAMASAVPAAAARRDGVWEGTIGTLPVRACFASRDTGAFGAYYYLSRLKLIPLDPEEGAGAAFREGGVTDGKRPRWLLGGQAGTRLEGEWSAGGRKLPIRLSRIPAATADSPCASLAFHLPRLGDVQTIATRRTVDGMVYTHLLLSHGERFEIAVETFALAGNGEATRRINAELRKSLDGTPPAWFGCVADSLTHSPFEGGFQESLVPAMASARWLSVRHHWDGFCGGAHPGADTVYRTFDLATGREVNLLGWFGDEAVKRERFAGSDEDSLTILPALRSIILAGWSAKDAPECDEVVRGEDFWNVGIERTGFVFTPSLGHAVKACTETFHVPFARVRSLLTAEAKVHVAASEAEPRSNRR